MGLLDSLGLGKKRFAEGELLEALLKAQRAGDTRQFARLCRDYVEVIIAAIPRWKIAPEEARKNPEALNVYIQTLSKAGQLLREAGHPQLWDALVGNPDENPSTIWNRKLKEAGSMSNELRYDEAAELLMNHLIDTRGLKGNAVDRFQALSQGSLGHARFAAGKVDAAVGHYEQALRLCREQNDDEGIRLYLHLLFESQRYLAKTDVAANYAKELEGAWEWAGKLAAARRYGRLSQIVRDGEPLLRMVAHCEGNVMELDDVEMKPSMKLEMHFWRNRPSLPGASKRIERGKKIAAKQQYDDALDLFREAAKVDPYEPDGHYQAGLVFCEQRLYPQAVEEYELCEKLAPGWYFCRSALWIAQQLLLGTMSHGVFLDLRYLQDGPQDPAKRLDLAMRIRPEAQKIPLFAPLFGDALEKSGRKKDAADVWREALKGEAEPDVRTRLLVALSMVEEDSARRRELQQQAVELDGNLMAAACAALSLRMGK